MRAQRTTLARILRQNRYTAFGLQHGFGTVRDEDAFTHRVPVTDATALIPWLRYREICDPAALCKVPSRTRTRIAVQPTSENDLDESLMLRLGADWGLPRPDLYFYEFAECGRWDDGDERTEFLDQIVRGRDYYLNVTSHNGLYRYYTGDVVRAGVRFRRLPTLRLMCITRACEPPARVVTPLRAPGDLVHA